MLSDRFWAKVNRTDSCWLWTASKSPRGYGQIRIGGRLVAAHRYSWELVNGPIPPGLLADHLCHVRNCVNPSHLRLVTPKQNQENKISTNHGVHFFKRTGKWTAYVEHNGKRHHLGYFVIQDEAVEAARLKRIELYTHNDRDRIANVR